MTTGDDVYRVLPPGWCATPLGDLLTAIETGKSFKCDERPPQDGEVGVVKVSAVSWGDYSERESKTCLDDERINPTLFIREGDFLFSRANTLELVGACVTARRVHRQIMLSDKILRFQFADDSLKPWVLRFLRSARGRKQIEALASGNQESMRNIGQEKIQQICIPLPPVRERGRIVTHLESLLSDLDTAEAELKAAQNKLALYRQSLLKAAVEGALTATWRAAHPAAESGAALLQRILAERRARWEAKQFAKFAEQGKTPPKDWQKKYPEPVAPETAGLPGLPDGWVWASVALLCEIQGGIQKQPSRAPLENKFPFLRVANVARGELRLEDVHEIELLPGELDRLALAAGDVLIVEGNGSLTEIGRCAVWDGSIPNTVHQNHLIRVRPIGVSGQWVEAWLNSPHGISKLTELAATTSGLYTLSVGKIAKIPVPLPPATEQSEALSAVKAAFASQLEQSEAVAKALKQTTAQRQNILRAAFSGQLVPQDPNDEPASVLLERIRAERAEVNPKRRGLRRTTSKVAE